MAGKKFPSWTTELPQKGSQQGVLREMKQSRFYVRSFTCLLTGPFQPPSSWGHRLSFNPSDPGKRIRLSAPEQMANAASISTYSVDCPWQLLSSPTIPEAPGFFSLFTALKLAGAIVKAPQHLSEEQCFSYLFGHLFFEVCFLRLNLEIALFLLILKILTSV